MSKMKKERLHILNGIKNITTRQRPCNMPLLLECRTFGSLPYVFPWEFSNTAKSIYIAEILRSHLKFLGINFFLQS